MTGHPRRHQKPPAAHHGAPHQKPAPKPVRGHAAMPTQRAVGNSALGNSALGNSAPGNLPALPFPLTLPSPPTPVKAYTVDLVIHGRERSYPNLSAVQARARLTDYWHRLHDDLDVYREQHKFKLDQRNEHWIVGFWSEVFGGVDLPDIDMWNHIGSTTLSEAWAALNTSDDVLRRQWEKNEASIDRGLDDSLKRNPLMAQVLAFDPDQMRIERATGLLEKASRELEDAWKSIEGYQAGIERGAGRAITGIRVSIVVLGAAAAGGGASFAGQGAGLVARSATSALTAGGVGTATEVFTQYGEIRIGARTQFDIGRIAKRGVTDTVLGFVGGVAGGKFASALKGSVARWVTGLSKARMAALGLTEEEILSKATSVMLDWAGGVGVTPLTTATGAVMQRALNGKWEIHNFDEFASHVFDDMITNGVMSAAMISSDHALAALLPPGRGGGGSTPDDGGGGGSSGGSSDSGTSSTVTATTRSATTRSATTRSATTRSATTRTATTRVPAGDTPAAPTTTSTTSTTGTRSATTRVPAGTVTSPDTAVVPSRTATRTPSVGDVAPVAGQRAASPRTGSRPGGTTESLLAGSPRRFLPHAASRAAVSSAPTAEVLEHFTEVRRIGGPGAQRGEGVNVKYLLRGPDGRQWLFKPAAGEANMGFGPALGINRGQRYRRAPAAALIADRLGIPTPAARLVTYNGRPGSLQEWWTGYRTVAELRTTDRAAHDQVWDSQQRRDLDAMDYVTAQQDRHKGNVYVRDRPGGGRELAAIDQDAAFPDRPERFDPGRSRAELLPWQRPLPATLSRPMAARLRDLHHNWPETELRQWLTQPETDGARARLTHIIDELDAGRITVTP